MFCLSLNVFFAHVKFNLPHTYRITEFAREYLNVFIPLFGGATHFSSLTRWIKAGIIIFRDFYLRGGYSGARLTKLMFVGTVNTHRAWAGSAVGSRQSANCGLTGTHRRSGGAFCGQLVHNTRNSRRMATISALHREYFLSSTAIPQHPCE